MPSHSSTGFSATDFPTKDLLPTQSTAKKFSNDRDAAGKAYNDDDSFKKTMSRSDAESRASKAKGLQKNNKQSVADKRESKSKEPKLTDDKKVDASEKKRVGPIDSGFEDENTVDEAYVDTETTVETDSLISNEVSILAANIDLNTGNALPLEDAEHELTSFLSHPNLVIDPGRANPEVTLITRSTELPLNAVDIEEIHQTIKLNSEQNQILTVTSDIHQPPPTDKNLTESAQIIKLTAAPNFIVADNQPVVNNQPPAIASEFIGPVKLSEQPVGLKPEPVLEGLLADSRHRDVDRIITADSTSLGAIEKAVQHPKIDVSQVIRDAITDTHKGDASTNLAPTSESPVLLKPGVGSSDSTWVQQFQQIGSYAETKNSGVQLQVPVPVQNSRWFAAIADRVSWLAGQAIQAAEIHLDPPELGPLQVRIAVNQDQASVNFVSNQAAVRDVLDSQLMRLRELFESEGMSLIDVNVSDKHQQEEQSESQESGSQSNSADLSAEGTPVPVTEIVHWVDYYV